MWCQRPIRPRVFLSYRRRDSKHLTDHLAEWLKARLGKQNVFIDLDDLPVGADFREQLRTKLLGSDLTFVIIGKDWAGSRQEARSRLFDADDPVRVEVETALSISGHRVVPLLIDGARLPTQDELPTSLHALLDRQYFKIDQVHQLSPIIAKLSGPPIPFYRNCRVIIAAAVLLVSAVIANGVHNRQVEERSKRLVALDRARTLFTMYDNGLVSLLKVFEDRDIRNLFVNRTFIDSVLNPKLRLYNDVHDSLWNNEYNLEQLSRSCGDDQGAIPALFEHVKDKVHDPMLNELNDIFAASKDLRVEYRTVHNPPRREWSAEDSVRWHSEVQVLCNQFNAVINTVQHNAVIFRTELDALHNRVDP